LPQHSDRNDQLNDSVEIIRKNYREYQADNSQSMIKHDRLQSRYSDIPILSQQSSHLSFDDILGDDKIEKPILVSRPASPRQAAFLGYTNALIDELTHAMTPTLALTVLTPNRRSIAKTFLGWRCRHSTCTFSITAYHYLQPYLYSVKPLLAPCK
jgi:hypothetical protein